MFKIKFCPWLDLNHRSWVSVATSQATEVTTALILIFRYFSIYLSRNTFSKKKVFKLFCVPKSRCSKVHKIVRQDYHLFNPLLDKIALGSHNYANSSISTAITWLLWLFKVRHRWAVWFLICPPWPLFSLFSFFTPTF